MKYRNKETGVVVDVQSELGGVWEPVKEKKAGKPKADAGEEKKPEE